MPLSELVDPHLMYRMVDEGFIRVQRHNTLPLEIFNYTPAAQYSRTWNDATRLSRGLILSDSTVIARPFPKFHNWNEPEAPKVEGPVEVYEKVDGSLGIIYFFDGRWHVATRGSFHSEQAQWAQKWLEDKDLSSLSEYKTYLTEIIYASNRIVVQYAWEGLALLAVMDPLTGQTFVKDVAPFAPIRKFPFASLTDVLAAPPVSNAEGYVVKFGDEQRVKVKHEEYVRLHRIITGLDSIKIWEHLGAGRDIKELLDGAVPDEFMEWVLDQKDALYEASWTLSADAYGEYRTVMDEMPDDLNEPRDQRKWFAQSVATSANRGLLFALYDHNYGHFSDAVWKRVKPVRTTPYKEDVEA